MYKSMGVLLAVTLMIGFLIGGISTNASFASKIQREIIKQCDIQKERIYSEGFNDALQDIALVNLEFAELKHEPKTFGELADICRERKGILRPDR